MRPKIHDDDVSTITIKVGDEAKQTWEYRNEDERRSKMRQAYSWCDGFAFALDLLEQGETV